MFINCMEKLTMNAPKETLRAHARAALDAGIDGITLAAGLHLGSFALIGDHRAFATPSWGSSFPSLRALQLFLKKTSRLNRLPDYIVVEALWPAAIGLRHGLGAVRSGHHRRRDRPVSAGRHLDIPLIPAGGIFTSSDITAFLEAGAAAVQVATPSP